MRCGAVRGCGAAGTRQMAAARSDGPDVPAVLLQPSVRSAEPPVGAAAAAVLRDVSYLAQLVACFPSSFFFLLRMLQGFQRSDAM